MTLDIWRRVQACHYECELNNQTFVIDICPRDKAVKYSLRIENDSPGLEVLSGYLGVLVPTQQNTSQSIEINCNESFRQRQNHSELIRLITEGNEVIPKHAIKYLAFGLGRLIEEQQSTAIAGK